MKKAVLLVRVSTEGQDYEAQTHDLQMYATSLGFTNLHIIADKESGVKLTEEQRNGLNEMKSYLISNSDCKDVFIWEISRLARTEKVLHSIKEWLVNAGIQLHIFDKRIKLLNDDGSENPNTSLIFSILGSFASQEAKTIKARFNRGKARNKELGKYNGGKIKFGYEKAEDGRFKEAQTGAIVRLIYDLYSTGEYSVSMVTEELQKRGYNVYLRAVTRILQDNCYTGQTEMHYPQIVSVELWNKCKEIRQSNNSKIDKNTTNNIAFARKLMKCDCGYNYSVKLNKIGWVYYCAGNTKRNMSGITPKDRCSNKMHMSRNWLDCLLWYVAKPMHEQRMLRINKEDADRLNEQIEILERKERVLYERMHRSSERLEKVADAWIEGLITESQKQAKIAQIRASEKQMNDEFTQLGEQRKSLVKLHRIALGIDPSPTQIKKDYSLDDMNKIVKENISKVELARLEKNNKITIHPITGDVIVYLFKRSSKVEKIYNEELQPLDDMIVSATKDYWSEREKESN